MSHTLIGRALALSWLLSAAIIGIYAIEAVSGALGATYLIAVTLLQATLLMIPLFVLHHVHKKFGWTWLAWLICSLSFALIAILLGNYKLHSMYNFFVDGFVINLVTTPGGIDALGLSPSFYNSAAIALCVGAVAYALAIRYLPLERATNIRLRKTFLIPVFLLLFTTEALGYAWASYTSRAEVLSVASRVVWHIPVTARSFFKNMGVEAPDPNFAGLGKKFSGQFSYPAVQMPTHATNTPYNIVWLTCESLRNDMLSPQIMPYTYAFAGENAWYKSHYSGSNGTRMGMFSQFYGLYPSYWADVLRERQSPAIIDTLLVNHYDMKAFTSARFTYPEFDKTIFSKLAPEQLQEFHEGKGWERDEKNTRDIVRHIENMSAKGTPFFTFMFFESAHANYYFPDSYAIEEDYLNDFDYLSVDIEENIQGIKNRYINASHYLDSRLGLVLDALKEQDLYDNTIVIITGDHGEEFMEKGRWGHNSTFVQEQIRVPLVIHIPGQKPTIYEHMTSHLDIPATLFSALGYNIDPRLYSFGQNLIADDYQRSYTVLGDWHGNALVTANTKFILSLKSSMNGMALSTIDDVEPESGDVSTADRAALAQFIRETPRFYEGSSSFKQNSAVAARYVEQFGDHRLAHRSTPAVDPG